VRQFRKKLNGAKEKTMKYLFFVCASVCVLSVLLICLFIFREGLPAFSEIGPIKFLTGMKWAPENSFYGIFPMIVGSLCVTAGAIIIGVPLGLMTAIYMAKFANKKIYAVLMPAISLMAGIPSVIYGFFGLVMLVPLMENITGSGKGLLTASIMLGIMILPTIISVSEASLRAVPYSYYEGALALGASSERAVFFSVLPAAKSGIFAAVVLGIGRAIGETMAVVMVAGNKTLLPDSINSGIRTLTSHVALEMGYASGLHRGALVATGVVLLVFILIINLLLFAIKKRAAK
jgi:phosphate transport system permease protein